VGGASATCFIVFIFSFPYFSKISRLAQQAVPSSKASACYGAGKKEGVWGGNFCLSANGGVSLGNTRDRSARGGFRGGGIIITANFFLQKKFAHRLINSTNTNFLKF